MEEARTRPPARRATPEIPRPVMGIAWSVGTVEKFGCGFRKWVSSNPPATGDFPAIEGCPRFGETVAKIPSKKAGDLATDRADLRAPPLLGFEAFSSSFNGGRRTGISPREFNMAEFLSLASRVMDEGDADAMEALVALKSRWERRFSNGATATKQTATTTVASLPHGRRPIQARRCLLGPANETRREDFISGPPSMAIGRVKGAGESTPLNGGKPRLDEDDGGPPALEDTYQIPTWLCEALPSGQGDEITDQTRDKHSGAIFRRTGEQPAISPTTSEVRRFPDVDVEVAPVVSVVDAEVVPVVSDVDVEVAPVVSDVDGEVASVGSELDAEVAVEVSADVSPSRADVISAARADVSTYSSADVIHCARADVTSYKSADVTAYTAVDVINPRADISSFMEEKNTRGLRQGDPLSPFLFVLVMEVLHIGYMQLIEQNMQFKYHWKCEPARVFQLGFADDLLLFCRADLDSVRVLKMGLDRFAEWSGLRKDQLLSILGFQEGHLPMRYLGLPLISSRLTISDCQPLLSKIDARIAGWEGMSLSYAGRVQIIKFVLSALSIYWASAFILPKAIIKEVEKRLRRFLWKGTSMTGYAKVAWKDVCKPVGEGGQGIKDIDALNRALMTKKLCDIIRCDRTSIWVEWLQRGRLQNNSIWTVDEKGGSWGWRKLLRLRSLIQPMVECRIGDGRNLYLWKDPWHHIGPLTYRFPRGPSLLGLDESTKLNTVINEGQWHWPLITDLECLQIIYTLPQIHDGDDRIIWRFPDDRPTAQALYRLICPPGPKIGWTSLLSGSLKIPRHCFILWMAIQEKLPTTDKPWLTHIGGCILCDEEATETHNHLFFRCRFSRRCLIAIREIIRFAWPNRTWAMDVEWAVRKWRGKHIINAAYRALLGSFVYHLWRERNFRRFQQIEHPPNVLASLIINDVRQRILSLNLSSSISTCALYRLWRIPWPVEGIPN
ncbi:UNVERIFIED_CONTAM: hypothetical protein Sindi_3020500 [Sesamum indicum]